jgi:hypothetical protein
MAVAVVAALLAGCGGDDGPTRRAYPDVNAFAARLGRRGLECNGLTPTTGVPPAATSIGSCVVRQARNLPDFAKNPKAVLHPKGQGVGGRLSIWVFANAKDSGESAKRLARLGCGAGATDMPLPRYQVEGKNWVALTQEGELAATVGAVAGGEPRNTKC